MKTQNMFVVSLMALVVSACSTYQENPNYEYSTTYKGSNPYVVAQNTGAQAATTQASTIYQPSQVYQQGNPVYGKSGSIVTQSAIPPVSAAPPVAIPPVSAPSLPSAGLPQSVTAPVQALPDIPSAPLPAPTPVNPQNYAGNVANPTGGVETLTISGPIHAAGEANPHVIPAPAPIVREHVIGQSTQVPPLGNAELGTPGYYAVNGTQNLSTVPNRFVTTAPAAPQFNTTQVGTGQAYAVKQGDTVYSLSRARCVNINDVQSLNGLDTNFSIQIGQVIQLPNSRC